jgi:hypothetical protein
MKNVILRKEVSIGNEKHILEQVETKHTDSFSSMIWRMWSEKNDKMIDCTFTTRQRLSKETKLFFGI